MERDCTELKTGPARAESVNGQFPNPAGEAGILATLLEAEAASEYQMEKLLATAKG